jgi:hypothetical protein
MIAPERKIIQQIQQKQLALDGAQTAFFFCGKTANPGAEGSRDRGEDSLMALQRRLFPQQPAKSRHGTAVREQDNGATQIRQLRPVLLKQQQNKLV